MVAAATSPVTPNMYYISWGPWGRWWDNSSEREVNVYPILSHHIPIHIPISTNNCHGDILPSKSQGIIQVPYLVIVIDPGDSFNIVIYPGDRFFVGFCQGLLLTRTTSVGKIPLGPSMIMVLTVISHGFAMILHIAIFRCFINLPQQWMLLISANICFMALSEDTVPNKNPKKHEKHPANGGLSFKSSFSLSNSNWRYHPFSDPKFQPKFVKSSVFIGEIILFGLWNPLKSHHGPPLRQLAVGLWHLVKSKKPGDHFNTKTIT